jgi:hypothetical protein
VPPPDAETAPVLITAYDGDPLQPHLARLGPLPRSWRAHPVGTPAQHQDESLAFLRAHPAPVLEQVRESADEGFARVRTDDFDGLIHWRGALAFAGVATPGSSAALDDGAAIDPPGHGLSDPWPSEPPTTLDPWRSALAPVANDLRWPSPPAGDPERLFPDLSPDRFGAYLTRAWSIVRARQLFQPWYEASAAAALPFDPADLAPERLAVEHRALLQAGPAARAFATALQSATGVRHVHS